MAFVPPIFVVTEVYITKCSRIRIKETHENSKYLSTYVLADLLLIE